MNPLSFSFQSLSQEPGAILILESFYETILFFLETFEIFSFDIFSLPPVL